MPIYGISAHNFPFEKMPYFFILFQKLSTYSRNCQIIYDLDVKNIKNTAAILLPYLHFSHKSHSPNHSQSRERYQGINGNAVKHGCQSCFLEIDDTGSQSNGRQGRNHQELADCFQ